MAYTLSELNRTGVPKLLAGIESPEQWMEKAKELEAVWIDYIGNRPELYERGEPDWELLSEAELEGHRRQHIRYVSAGGDFVTAYLLHPHSEAAGKNAGKRLPAIVAMHPTSNSGKDDIATPDGRENRRYALELAQRGYVVLAPDTITAGERVYTAPYQTAPFYEKHPEWTAVGKMLVDHLYGVDLLCRLDGVDPGRIGAIGHSLGGYNAFFLAGLDKRIKAFVSSCGFATFTGDPNPNRWGVRDWFTHIPRFTDDLKQDKIPFEFHEIAALAAPASAFFWSGQTDHIFPHWKDISQAMAEVGQLYRLLGAEDRFLYLMGSGDHDFPGFARKAAYDFLDRWLKPNE
jgi:dienelactone hydrolase